MLLGWTSHLLNWVQGVLDRYQTTEMDEQFTPRRNMYLWGIGYSAAVSYTHLTLPTILLV